ncbi:hypothetical protein [Romboutsia sp.]
MGKLVALAILTKKPPLQISRRLIKWMVVHVYLPTVTLDFYIHK